MKANQTQITPAAGHVGAWMSGVQLDELAASDEHFEELQVALAHYGVVFLRDQVGPTADLAALARRFGEVLPHGAYPTHDDACDVQILESTAEAPSKIERWHSDMTFSATPPSVTVLRAEVVPAVGGDTLWSSAAAAFDALSPQLQALLLPLTATHDFRFGFRESLAEPGGEERLAEAIAANPPVSHPVVITHPLSGRRALFVNPLFTTRINELTASESAALLAFLCNHSVSDAFTVRLSWQPNTVAIWDNRLVLHKPVNDFGPSHRRLQRITLAGPAPTPAA